MKSGGFIDFELEVLTEKKLCGELLVLSQHNFNDSSDRNLRENTGDFSAKKSSSVFK